MDLAVQDTKRMTHLVLGQRLRGAVRKSVDRSRTRCRSFFPYCWPTGKDYSEYVSPHLS
jgi:hypothetical protein